MNNKPTVRCAIYTRKSSNEGLDQEFNSLDAQYEACVAYTASQRHEGWKLVSHRYDDGGVSGGTLERPALNRLLNDIDAGRIGMIIVYKIDRLTRSLADFAKLIERLDAANCSFVSITQAFNTSSSMGRLTLNVLLSFAQFEREVTAERIRDKIAASKKKGLWMGGSVPLGFDRHTDPKVQSLVVNRTEAKTVQTLFELYEQKGCLRRVADTALKLGLRSKYRVSASGRKSGGSQFTRGQIHHLLTNPVYLGKIRHKDKVWPGLHDAIITQEVWDRVQIKLQAASARARGEGKSHGTANGKLAGTSILVGKFRDDAGDRLTPSHTTRRGKKMRYYVSNRLLKGDKDASGWRLPAPALESAVRSIVAEHINECALHHKVLEAPTAGQTTAVSNRALNVSEDLGGRKSALLRSLIKSGLVSLGQINIELNEGVFAKELSVPVDDLNPAALSICAPFQMRRRGVETRLIAGIPEPAPDTILIRALALAHRFVDDMRKGISMIEIAKREKHSESYVRTRAQLAFLSPKIQTAILQGTQPPELSLERIVRSTVPLDWKDQERAYGFDV